VGLLPCDRDLIFQDSRVDPARLRRASDVTPL
jgi:hypothetical protein